MSSAAGLKDKCDVVGLELPWGWGNVLTAGTASMGAATLTGKDAKGKALTGLTVKVDAAAVSRRSVKVLV